MFRCLVMCISLYYVHTRARYIYLATILRPDHVRGVSAGFSNIPSAGASRVSFYIRRMSQGRLGGGSDDDPAKSVIRSRHHPLPD
jgi:hypothetical protein